MMMRERQERRKARREARSSPYLRTWSVNAPPLAAQTPTTHKHPASAGGDSAMEVDANLETTNVSDNVSDNSSYVQIKTSEPVVA